MSDPLKIYEHLRMAHGHVKDIKLRELSKMDRMAVEAVHEVLYMAEKHFMEQYDPTGKKKL